MPIISKIGTRSPKVRTLFGLIYGVLILGSITMIYPFTLMLAGSMKSEADSRDISIYPKFWTDDTILFRKYAESKHNNNTRSLSSAWGRSILTFSEIESVVTRQTDILRDYLAWRETDGNRWWYLGHTGGGKMLPINGRLYRREMIKRFDGSIEAYGVAMKVPVQGWNAVSPVPASVSRFTANDRPDTIASRAFAATRPIQDRVVRNVDGDFLTRFIIPTYGKHVEDFNESHGTAHLDYSEVFLTHRAPREGVQRSDWETYVRKKVRLDVIRIDDSAADAFTAFLKVRYGNIKTYNAVHATGHRELGDIKMPRMAPSTVSEEVDWEAFVKEACPLEALEVYGPRQAFEAFMAKQRGVTVDAVRPLVLPLESADYHDCMADTAGLRREFSTRNYAHVFEYIARHGNGILNTIIYCLLAIVSALVINPMAAYALSRYRPASTYTILLICMATMAFPGEVTMIPAFLLLKRFPLWPLIAGIVTMFGAFMLLKRTFPKWPEMWRMAISVTLACLVGAYLFPVVLGLKNVSLLNTFAALILPGMANGFMIFMLKGFFDSLPQELYEAAEIDGASEWMKFWTITMSLSKPILAVFALQAFTAAYSAFMMALIIIPDQDMWTLMIWVFQLQSEAHSAVVYASLVVTAVPTFLVFAFCQNIIIRGIVVPVEK
jgi:multiple sugar transport system permease protein